ncbi:hypothetical protein [Actinoplanes couchii]|uniref:Uncharacterized protein n=1 Tax=Actinoplanes couchii TaxID=403638 RepID=A0ABQ3XRP6_9ACTN|nr:hypothetical protein [Actinoplanes couchii]MDR6318903.1 hypothetical protein [Actinoplanes couchii]GID61158.1 hypothetical protein Aco03nite_095620 [Actinoplanes couchii]
MDINPPYPPQGRSAAGRPKVCRSCQDRMPAVCDGCGQKTPSYCIRCRPNRDRPTVDSGANLDDAIGRMMRTQPLPGFAGITGWTAGRAAVHLPGHTPAAILAALRRLTARGDAVLIGDNPERYRPN